MKADYTMVTRSPSGPEGPTEIGYVATIGANVFVSKPVPGKPLPVCYSYRDDAASRRDGWRVPSHWPTSDQLITSRDQEVWAL